MNNIQKRFLLFIFGCVVARLLFVYIAKNIKSKYLPILGYLSLIPAFGFIYIYYNNLRKTGQEVFGDKIISVFGSVTQYVLLLYFNFKSFSIIFISLHNNLLRFFFDALIIKSHSSSFFIIFNFVIFIYM